jgi:hypothetical protein
MRTILKTPTKKEPTNLQESPDVELSRDISGMGAAGMRAGLKMRLGRTQIMQCQSRSMVKCNTALWKCNELQVSSDISMGRVYNYHEIHNIFPKLPISKVPSAFMTVASYDARFDSICRRGGIQQTRRLGASAYSHPSSICTSSRKDILGS